MTLTQLSTFRLRLDPLSRRSLPGTNGRGIGIVRRTVLRVQVTVSFRQPSAERPAHPVTDS